MNDYSTFPNILSIDSEKNSKEFGLKFMRSAYERWAGGVRGENATSRRSRFDYNRAFASGQQPMQEYKDILDLDGDMSVINLSYDPLPIAIPFIARATDRFMQRVEKIQCNAIDPLSQTKREKAKADALFKLKEKQKIQALQDQAGVQVEEFTDDDPEDEKELELRFGFTYKQREEVIMEQGIDLVFYDNDWSGVIKKRVIKDLMECGIAQVKPYIDANGRIKFRFTLPENIIASYTTWDDFRDCQYQGEVYEMSISDIRLKYPGKVSEKELWELSKSKIGLYGNPGIFNWDWNPNYTTAIARPYDDFKVVVEELNLKTLYNLTYESTTDRFGKEVLDRVTTKKEGKKYIEKPYYVSYTGVWIVESNHLLEWGLSKNMIKPDKNLVEVKLPWVTYMYNNEKMTNKPLVETMIPSIKKMQLIDLQQQKIIANAAPDGFKVDISTMSDITLGKGMEDLTPFDLYKIYKQTGVQYYKRIADEGVDGGYRSEPIEPMNVPFSGKLEQLSNMWNLEYDKLMRIIGSNNLDSGVIQNQAVGKSVLQDAKQIGESSLNYIYDGVLNIMVRTARISKELLSIILFHGKKDGVAYYDGYRMALGSERVEYIRIEGDDDFERADFDIKIQAVVDDKEAEYLERQVEICLQNETIDLDDAIVVRLLAKTNLKYAAYYLASCKKKRRKERMEESQALSASNTEQAIAAAQAKSQGEMELEKLKSDLKIQQDASEIDKQKEIELIKYTSILKANVASAIMNKEGSSINDLPTWVTDGIGIIDVSNQQMMEGALADQEDQELLEQQQMAEEEQAMMQQQQEQQMMPPQEEMVA